MRFNIEDYPGNYAMHCKTLREAKSFLAHLNALGKTWSGGSSYIRGHHWEPHMENTVYAFNEGRYSSMGYYRNISYEVLEWSDFMYDTLPIGKIDDINDYDTSLIYVAGYEWFMLPEENGLIPIVAKDSVYNTCINYDSPRNNNFAESQLLTRLEYDVLPSMEEKLGTDNIVEFTTDLTSLYGETDYGTISTKVSIPTFEFYRKHIKAFDKHIKRNRCFWLATPWTTLNKNNMCVASGGRNLYEEDPQNSYSVHPILYIKADALTTQN